MFEELDYQGEGKIFDKYVNLKGKFLHKQIYDVLLDKNKNEVKYSKLSSIIRYDKCLRDLLYKYLGTFEEWLRSVIFNKYDVANRNVVYKHKNYDRLVEDAFEKESDDDFSNLYFCFELELYDTIEFVKNKMLFDKEMICKFDKIRKLRNMVMHHNIVVIGNSEKWNKAIDNKNKVYDYIDALCDCLPDDYKAGFKSDINKLICDVKELKIVME